MPDPTITLLLILFSVALIAGIIDAIAGGGGLLVMPALLLAGLPPITALGTNKFQGLFGTGSATFTFARKGLLDIRAEWWKAGLCFLAALVGVYVATLLPTDLLAKIMPAVLIAIAIYFALSKKLNNDARNALLPPIVISTIALPLIGFYDGIFGPGAGSFYMLVLVSLAGHGIVNATARTKLYNFASNVGGFVGFLAIGAIAWKIGLVMAIGQIIGGRIGANLAIANGAQLIRPILVIVCIAMALRLLWVS